VAPLVDPPPTGVARPKGGKTNKVAQEITVDQIRGLIGKLSLTPGRGLHKAAIIDEAQLMNGEAQNCLLKTLEEPPGSALIILIAQNADRLMETVRSRAEILQFNFVSEKEMEILARDCAAKNDLKLNEAELKEVVKLSFGRPGRLVDFLTSPDQMKKWLAFAKEFAQIITAELPEKFAYAKKITDKENSEIDLNEIMEIWQFHFRNLLLESLKTMSASDSKRVRPFLEQKGSNSFREFEFSKLKEKAGDNSPEKISDILKKIHELSVILLTTNASPRLAIENFMLDL
jgi:DNA polymerase-3 subunit delta'